VYDKIDTRHEDMMRVNKNEFISYYKTTTHFLDISGGVTSYNSGTSYMTDFIKCDSDDIFEYTGCGKHSVASIVWYDSDLNKISHDQYDDNEPHEVTPPEGAEYVRFCSFQYTNDVKNLKFNLVNKKYTSFIENKISDIKNILSNNINRNIFIPYYLYNRGYLSNTNGKITALNNAITYITDFIKCANDDVFEYTGYAFSNTASVCWYDSNLNFISSEVYGDMLVHELTPPNNAEYCKFASYSHINQINNPNKLLVRFKKYKHEVFDRLTKLETNTYLFPDYTSEKNIIATYNDLQQDGYIKVFDGIANTTDTHGKLTDFYNIDDHPVIILTSRQQYETTIIAIYDKDDNFIVSLEPKKTNEGSTTGLAVVVTDKEYNFIEIRKTYPHASKFRCSIYDSSTFELYEYTNLTLYNKITSMNNFITNTNKIAFVTNNKSHYISYYTVNGFLNKQGTISNFPGGVSYLTNYVRCDSNDKIKFKGYGTINTVSICWYDKNLNFISYEQFSDDNYHYLTPPENTYYGRFCAFSYGVTPTHKLEVCNLLYVDNGYFDNRFIDYSSQKNTVISYENLPYNGYIDHKGVYHENENSRVSDFYNFSEHPLFMLTSQQNYETTIITIYDDEENFITSLEYKNGLITVEDKIYNYDNIILKYPNATKFRVGVYATTKFEFYEYSKLLTLNNKIDDMDNRINILSVGSGNVLYGKKYVSAGDSFTVNTVKPYPMWIAERNAMSLVNEAISGTTMAIHRNYFLDPENFDEENAKHFANKRYKAIPDDADYLTLCFGLNETGHWPTNVNDANYPTEHPELAGTKIVPIGTSSDYTDKTTWGAWNLSLDYIIEHHPFLKIGIIIADAWMTQELHDTLIAIAKYWGIPYLDLKNGENVPLGISDRFYTTSSRARNLRTNAFRVSEDDSHPNLEAHKYRSTIIENFLRSL
jgi:hypothetical protein